MSGQDSLDYYHKHKDYLLPKQAEWRREHPSYMREYCRAWRARRARQAVSIDRFWSAWESWEHSRRCMEIRNARR